MALESFQQQKACIAVAYEPQARKDVADALRCAEAVSKALIKSAINSRIVKITKDLLADKDYLQAALKRECPLVFNLFEGFNDDARAEIEFARLLEKANVCFTGNSSKTLNDCLDKLKTKQILYSEGITIPRGFLIRHENEIDDLLKVDIALPFFIKPCFEDASVGIDAASLINQRETIYTQITDKLRDNPGGILVEEFIPGNEYTVAMLAPEEDKIIGVSRIDYKLYP
ncbi:MAG: D-alanine--D-alanine ligase, partial [Candidatus Omnitrophica bacterium]|nr:D-alanine--D-alanine ligase [Candidatus Omnitrophota bacterium]